MANYKIYADGACSGNPGPGGWGFAVISTDRNIKLDEGSGNSSMTTNNKMELMAAISALNWAILHVRNDRSIEIIMDSQYVIRGITSWMKVWINNNWKTSTKKPVKNIDLWQKLNQNIITLYNNRINLIWTWTKGHSEDKMNKYVDKLATKAIIK